MPNPELGRKQPFYDSTASLLVHALQFDQSEELVGVSLPEGWTEINSPVKRGFRHPYKVIVQNPVLKVFTKIYTPETKNYARNAHDGLQALAKLKLNKPILAPEGISSRVIFFAIGEPTRRVRYDNCFSHQERDAINSVLKAHSLVSLELSDEVDIVSVDGAEYVADPFDDSGDSIFNFLYPLSS